MNIQLKGMAFNDDVTFGKVVEINDEIKKLFTLSGYTKSISDEKKFALQQAIESLQTEGIWDKIDKLYIPILAGSENEAFLNIKGSYANNNVIDVTTNGITTSINGNEGASLSGTLTPVSRETSTGLDIQVESLESVHFGIKIPDKDCGLSGSLQLQDIGDNTNNGRNFFGMQANSDSIFNVSINGGYTALNGIDFSFPMIASLGTSYNCGFSYAESSIVKYNVTPVEENWQQDFKTLVSPIKMVAFKTWDNKLVPMRKIQFLTMGKGLSENDSKKYNQIIHDLFTTLLA